MTSAGLEKKVMLNVLYFESWMVMKFCAEEYCDGGIFGASIDTIVHV